MCLYRGAKTARNRRIPMADLDWISLHRNHSGLILESSETYTSSDWKEEGRDNYFLLRQLWFSEGLLGLDPPFGEGANPAAFPSVNRNLCKVYVFRGQPGHSPSAFTQKYYFFKFRLQLKTDELFTTERQKKVHREGDIRCFSVSLGNLVKYQLTRVVSVSPSIVL